MGCDIHVSVEVLDNGTWSATPQRDLFQHRWYPVFALLAGVRNSADYPSISEPRGLPGDVTQAVKGRFADEDDRMGVHTPSWLTVDELLAFDYLQPVEGRAGTTTYGEVLQPPFFRDLAELQALNEVQRTRIVFWFDN